MRAKAAKKLLDYLESAAPEWAARLEMQILLDTTARGFGVKRERIAHLPAEEGLAAYAAFTEKCMEKLDAPGRDASERREALRRLYRGAYRTGSRVRRLTGITESREIGRLVFYLYRNLQIAMEGHIPGEITVTECYFSRRYTPGQCAVMSMVDSGIIAGICGGGKLRFTGRITEGCRSCTACFTGERKEKCAERKPRS